VTPGGRRLGVCWCWWLGGVCVWCWGSPPLECMFGYIPFSRRWDTVRYSGIQLDTARNVRIQLVDTVRYSRGYSGSAAKLLDVDRYRDTAGYQGYGERKAEYRLNTGIRIQAGHPKNTRQGRALGRWVRSPSRLLLLSHKAMRALQVAARADFGLFLLYNAQ